MEIITTPIPDLLLIKPMVFKDDRGYFMESFNYKKLEGLIPNLPFVQDNEALSSIGVLRGLHYQVGPMAQAKLVRVVQGSVFDVAVDIREGSPTYGKWFGEILSSENKYQLYVPRGFAHGYLTLSDDTIFTYKCDNYYSKEHEGGIRFDDPNIGIEWPELESNFLLSAKDTILPQLGSHIKFT